MRSPVVYVNAAFDIISKRTDAAKSCIQLGEKEKRRLSRSALRQRTSSQSCTKKTALSFDYIIDKLLALSECIHIHIHTYINMFHCQIGKSEYVYIYIYVYVIHIHMPEQTSNTTLSCRSMSNKIA